MPQLKQGVLPYEEITAVASRSTYRSVGMRIGTESYRIPLRLVVHREGFNARRKPIGMSDADYYNDILKIPDLAQQLINEGQLEAIRGDLSADGSTFYTSEGHRRGLAFQLINSRGIQAEMQRFMENGEMHVLVTPNPSDWTEADRTAQTVNSNDKLPLRPLELAYQCLRYKQQFEPELTNEEVGKKFRQSRQWADQMIKLTELPEAIQAQIDSGDRNYTKALKDYAAQKKAEKDAAKQANQPANQPDEEISSLEVRMDALAKEIRQKLPGTIGADDRLTYKYDDLVRVACELYPDISPEDAVEEVVGILSKSREFTIDNRPENLTPSDGPKNPAFNADEIGLIDTGVGRNGDELQSQATVNYDRSSIEAAEAEYNKATDPKFREQRPKSDQADALPKMDFKAQKTEAEMDLTEGIKMLDKLNVMLDSLPKSMKQLQDDAQRLIVITQRKMENARETIKKAADEI